MGDTTNLLLKKMCKNQPIKHTSTKLRRPHQHGPCDTLSHSASRNVISGFAKHLFWLKTKRVKLDPAFDISVRDSGF